MARCRASVAWTYDIASRFRRSSSAGPYLDLTPTNYEFGEISRTRQISKRGDKLTRTNVYEGVNVILTRQIGFSSLKVRCLRIGKGMDFKKAKVRWRATLPSSSHGMCKTNESALKG
ncbi:transposase [Mesorhizobium sp. M0292]|uniref:transposase n=1 Tax=Mesorhizobium sp. M0292 TaxID=2956929 RepID=UPI00333AFDE7